MIRYLYHRLPLPIKYFVRRTMVSCFGVTEEWTPDPRVSIGKYSYGIVRSTIPTLVSGMRIDVGKFFL
jgi:hypothetical protein